MRKFTCPLCGFDLHVDLGLPGKFKKVKLAIGISADFCEKKEMKKLCDFLCARFPKRRDEIVLDFASARTSTDHGGDQEAQYIGGWLNKLPKKYRVVYDGTIGVSVFVVKIVDVPIPKEFKDPFICDPEDLE